MTGLTNDEVKRYGRHLVLEEFGLKNQLRLKGSSVLVIGAGGLGSPVLLYLAAAGIGTLGVVDDDVVDLSNLQRQVLFTTKDIGKNKAEAAIQKLYSLNPLLQYVSYPFKIISDNAMDIIRNYDVVIDGSDNFPTRYLVNDCCVLLDKPLVYGSILKFEGQLSVFNLKRSDGQYSCNYRDLFPDPPLPNSVPNCEQAGVIGALAGIIGSMQANEAIKIICGTDQTLHDKLMILDSTSMQQVIIQIKNHNARNRIKNLIDYEDFCGVSHNKNKSLESKPMAMKEITVQELQKLQKSGADFQLIDVREPHEFDICNLNGELIPQGEIPHSVDRISRNKQVVIHCRSGARSGNMVQWLEKNHGFENLYNLKGGILAWAKEVDPSMPTY
ncbi:MAG: ThiF family adenylyltransferase [Cyclobacteriaceae bacterium]|nr:ThiF family adenylyltransferase [Cyclobacteriaceae bacterium]